MSLYSVTRHDGILSSSPQVERDQRVRILALAVFALLCFSGDLKATPLFAWLPFDLTLLAALSATAIALYLVGRMRARDRLPAYPTILWAAWLPAAALSSNLDKVLLLYSLTLFCVTAPYFVSAKKNLNAWAGIQIAFGAIVGATLLAEGPAEEGARLTLEGGTTITLARILGQAILLAILIFIARPSRSWLWAPAFGVGGTLLLLFIGSRGPVISLIITFIILLLFGHFGARQRLLGIATGVGVILTLQLLTSPNQNEGASRIIALLSGDSDSSGRNVLYQLAWEATNVFPFGLGWGGYGSMPDVINLTGNLGSYPHNLILEIVVEAGWLPAIVFTCLTVMLLARGYRHHDKGVVLVAGAATYWLLAAMFSSDINGNRAMWFTLGLLACCLQLPRESERHANV